VALVEMIGKLGRTFGHGVTYDANLHAKLRRRYPAVASGAVEPAPKRALSSLMLWRSALKGQGLIALAETSNGIMSPNTEKGKHHIVTRCELRERVAANEMHPISFGSSFRYISASCLANEAGSEGSPTLRSNDRLSAK
jgi:hypothetical protein